MVAQDMNHWLELCDKAGVPAGPINNFAQAMQDEHYLARGMVQEMDHPVIGKMKTIGFQANSRLRPRRFAAQPAVRPAYR